MPSSDSDQLKAPAPPSDATALILAFAAVTMLLMPALDAGGVIDHFTLNLWGKYLCYALLALSVDLLWGGTGLLSLGQALFFALGGYMHGMYLMRMIGDQGQYHKPIPDFLVFLGWTDLPAFWKPLSTSRSRCSWSSCCPAWSRGSSAGWPSGRASRECTSPS